MEEEKSIIEEWKALSEKEQEELLSTLSEKQQEEFLRMMRVTKKEQEELVRKLESGLEPGFSEHAQKILDEYGTPEYTQFIRAVRNNDVFTVKRMLKGGFSPNSIGDWNMLTPLHVAVVFSSYDCIKALLNAGADPKLQDAEGISPIDCARNPGKTEILDLLRRRLQPTPLN